MVVTEGQSCQVEKSRIQLRNTKLMSEMLGLEREFSKAAKLWGWIYLFIYLAMYNLHVDSNPQRNSQQKSKPMITI